MSSKVLELVFEVISFLLPKLLNFRGLVIGTGFVTNVEVCGSKSPEPEKVPKLFNSFC